MKVLAWVPKRVRVMQNRAYSYITIDIDVLNEGCDSALSTKIESALVRVLTLKVWRLHFLSRDVMSLTHDIVG